jgi:hypothetical protein
VILLFLTLLTAYEMLWAMATEVHPELKAQYRLVEDDPRVSPASAAYNKHYTKGDFDGDREADYALVVTPVGSEGYCVLALLTRGKGSTVAKVSCGVQARPGAVTLALPKTPTRSSGDTLLVTPGEAPPLQFEWRSASGSFHEVQSP